MNKVRMPNPMTVGKLWNSHTIYPNKISLKDAKKAHDWFGRLVKYLEQKESK